MKMCFVADGASLHTQRWLNYLAVKGYEVHLLCWKIMPGYNSDIHIHFLRRIMPKIWPVSQYASFVYWCFQARRIIKKIQPDIVDGHYVTIYGFIAACSGYHPLIVTAWGSDILIFSKNNIFFRFLARYAMRKADRIVCTSSAVREEILKLSIDSNKVSVIVIGGIDRQKFHPGVKNEFLMKELGIKPDDPVVISTRMFAPVYDVITLIKAIPAILSIVPNAKFIIVGEGEQEYYLRRTVTDLQVQNNIAFTGWINHDRLCDYLSLSDIYVSTSLSDGTSNCLLEAMACELSPVVTDIPANRQWIEEAINGFFFPAKDHIALSKKIVQLLNDGDTKKMFGYQNRKLITSQADPESEMQKLETTYKQLINKRR